MTKKGRRSRRPFLITFDRCRRVGYNSRKAAIVGAVQGARKNQLTPERKAELRAFFDGLSGT